MKASVRRLALSALALALALSVAAFSAYAWFASGDRIDSLRFRIINIDSTVTLYRAEDSNFNGIPDIAVTPAEMNYYTENYAFTQVGDINPAQIDDPEGEIDMLIALEDAYPSKIYTYKFALYNQSDADNVIALRFSGLEALSAADKAVLSCFTVTVSPIYRANDGVRSTSYIESFGEKVYLSELIAAAEAGGAGTVSELFTDSITSILGKGEENLNCFDFWIQLEMEPYEELSGHDGFSLTRAAFNDLQGSTVSGLPIRIYFEVTSN